MTRVLFVTESYLPVLGGAERHLHLAAEHLARSEMRVEILTRRGDEAWPERERIGEVEVHRVGPPGPGRRGKYGMVPGVVRALLRDGEQHDLVVVRGTRVLGLPVTLTARRLGLPIALQCEVSGEMSGEAYVWGTPFQHGVVRRIVGGLTRLRNRALAKAEAFVAISEETRSEFLAAGLDPSRVHLVPHGVDLQRFRPASPGEKARLRETLGLPTKAALVCFTGRLLRGKGVETLLAAAAALRGDLPRLHVLLVGSGAGQALSVEPHLRARAAEEDLRGAVTFAGRVDNVEDYLRAADLFAFPSLYEAMPLSVLEAAASALPTVATAVGGIRDVLEDGRSGLLVRPGDVTGLREGLASLLRESSRAAEMGRAARASVEAGFDLRRNLERYRDLLRETAAAGAARHRET